MWCHGDTTFNKKNPFKIGFFIKATISIVSRSFPVFNIRLPEELKQRIEAAALQNKRSQNAEYLHRLEQSFLQEAQLQQILDELHTLKALVQRLHDEKLADNQD